MTKKLTFAFAIAGFVMNLGFAQDKDPATAEKKAPAAQAARQTAEATWPEGKLTLSYGSPAWKEEYKAKATEAGFVWRFGNNQWTTANLAAGLESAQGAIPPGEYAVAMRSGASSWDLLFYEASAFYDKGYKTWEIKSSSTAELKTPKANFALRFDGKNLIAEFGPMSVTWTLKPIKVLNPPITTEFAQIATKFEFLALPLAGTTFKDTTIGVVTAKMEDVTARWHIRLTTEGEKATLNFVNERAGYVAKEKESLETIVKRITEMVEKAPERKEMAEPILAGFKTVIDLDDAMIKRFERLNATQTVEGSVAKRDTAATELGVSSDRPMRAIVIKLALANSDASFEIKPREQFMKPRKKAE